MQMCRHRPAAQRRRLQRQLAVSQPVSPSAREKVRKLGGGCAAKNRKIPGPTTMHHPNCSLLCVCFEKREAISKHTLSCVFILCLSIRYVRAREHFDSSPPGEGRRARPPSLQLQRGNQLFLGGRKRGKLPLVELSTADGRRGTDPLRCWLELPGGDLGKPQGYAVCEMRLRHL